MRERSHEKGKAYQQAVRQWLTSVTLFGTRVRAHGNAYDVTASSAQLGGKQFDFSLVLCDECEPNQASGIIFVECKYRSETDTSTNGQFQDFLRVVLTAFARATADEKHHARFLFVTTTPPSSWANYLRRRIATIRTLEVPGLPSVPEEDLAKLAYYTEMLVLTPSLLGGTY